jgi:hypothetical protein
MMPICVINRCIGHFYSPVNHGELEDGDRIIKGVGDEGVVVARPHRYCTIAVRIVVIAVAAINNSYKIKHNQT